ncbi:SDR family oxidoreductase [Candidatus Protochlamydia amoebophila]|uniref:SDR family oxidoreductase n=1 Tax=Candidatus Protochlamydia amoebophila TaxID=362787 RepID=UPI00057F867B|nr:SDR family oxidoreductase [Candidatus Protochlamydia amoebophila]
MRIGILGCGYVGQAAAVFWKNQSHFLTVTTRQIEKINFLQTFAHQVHQLTDDNILPFLANQDILLVSVAAASSRDYQNTYLETAQRIIELLPQTPSLKQIIYTGSTSVYGDFQGNWVDENTLLNPLNEQSYCLSQTEQFFLKAPSSVNVTIFRLGEIYGPGRWITDRVIRMHQHSFPGTGNQLTNVIHLTDIVRALDFALQNKLHGIFNLCNDFHIPRKLFYEQLLQSAHLPSIQWDANKPSLHGGNKKVSSLKLKKLGFSFLENGPAR